MESGLTFALGVLLAAAGGEVFVQGAVGLARRTRIPSGVIAATIGALASASPEFSVAIDAALRGQPGIALGDAAGSNVVNIGLILGLTLLISGGITPRAMARRDLFVGVLAPIMTLVLAAKGILGQADGILLLALFGAWLTANVHEARQSRKAHQQIRGTDGQGTDKQGTDGWRTGLLLILGLGFLAGAGDLLISGALGLGHALGVKDFAISSTMVAMGTAAPELSIALIAALRGHHDISLGALLGSNIFNGLAIVGTAVAIHPYEVSDAGLRLTLISGAILVLFTWPTRRGIIQRWRALILLVVYAGYVFAVVEL